MKTAPLGLMLTACSCMISCGSENSPGSSSQPTSTSSSSNNTNASSPSENPGGTILIEVEQSVWGSSQSALNVQSDRALFRKGCGSGVVARMLTDANGIFDLPGTYQPTIGIGPTYKARYQGHVTGDTMAITVSWTDGAGQPMSFSDSLQLGFEGPLPTICSTGP